MLGRLRREGRELCLTWWFAEDAACDCLCQAALPVPRLRNHISDKRYYNSGSDGGLGLRVVARGLPSAAWRRAWDVLGRSSIQRSRR